MGDLELIDTLATFLTASLFGGMLCFTFLIFPLRVHSMTNGGALRLHLYKKYCKAIFALSLAAALLLLSNGRYIEAASLLGVAIASLYLRTHLLSKVIRKPAEFGEQNESLGQSWKTAIALNSTQIICVGIIFWSLIARPGAAPVEEVALDESPREVMESILEALQTNDSPSTDAGIRYVFGLAHPDNLAVTGPIERFTRIIKGEKYKALLNHKGHAIEEHFKDQSMAVYQVTIWPENGELVEFVWHMQRVEGGELNGAWRTTIVTPSRPSGRVI